MMTYNDCEGVVNTMKGPDYSPAKRSTRAM